MVITGQNDETADDTLVFELKVKCKKNPSAAKDATDPSELYVNHRGG